MVSTAIILFCTCAAFVAGFIDSIAGGGGLITIPALLLSGLPPQLALGTNKVGCCLGTGVAMLNFARSNLILWRLASLYLWAIAGGALPELDDPAERKKGRSRPAASLKSTVTKD